MNLIKNGNFTYVVRTCFSIVGALLIGFVIYFEITPWARWSIGMIGLLLGCVGMYSAKAAIFGLHPFDNAPWRKAKSTYKSDCDDSEAQ